MEAELEAIHQMHLPDGHKPIGQKWVFKIKKDSEGVVVKHKARLVVKGYVQRKKVDFDEEGWHMHYMDVKSAFLNGELEEEVYVFQPPGSLLSLGFEKSPLEHAVYKRCAGESKLLIGVYVDDLIITGSDDKEVDRFKKQMIELFQMSNLGLLSYYLGIEVSQTPSGITMSQVGYTKKILEKTGMSDCNSCQTPMETRTKLSKLREEPPVEATYYNNIVRSLRYLVNTRPDISYTVGIMSRFMEKLTTQHLATMKQILRYIRGTLDMGCIYTKREETMKLVGYSDNDLAGDLDDRKSTTGAAYFYGGNLITWVSWKQRMVTLSSCEAEYVAAAITTCLGTWLSHLLADLRKEKEGAVILRIDNKSTISLCKNPLYHDRSKHIYTCYHYIHENVENGRIIVEHVTS
ncbi:uncharacterized mitochondrial protein AtMg00810-like [Dioscorea cayenensis subsp. rotundata]|uniref:Uncharacterized mitochondrial protein AtMg00810-like n=1 Tax=Dioscorea cayennensis subsp. rotundata TaxID=55577 RepID=A0AB40D1Q8_DIOCR|nr:uncharacterized mitochondrial protein AtMg00810-like [Dioscorea cayenensis subsp. rotundata]